MAIGGNPEEEGQFPENPPKRAWDRLKGAIGDLFSGSQTPRPMIHGDYEAAKQAGARPILPGETPMGPPQPVRGMFDRPSSNPLDETIVEPSEGSRLAGAETVTEQERARREIDDQITALEETLERGGFITNGNVFDLKKLLGDQISGTGEVKDATLDRLRKILSPGSMPYMLYEIVGNPGITEENKNRLREYVEKLESEETLGVESQAMTSEPAAEPTPPALEPLPVPPEPHESKEERNRNALGNWVSAMHYYLTSDRRRLNSFKDNSVSYLRDFFASRRNDYIRDTLDEKGISSEEREKRLDDIYDKYIKGWFPSWVIDAQIGLTDPRVVNLFVHLTPDEIDMFLDGLETQLKEGQGI